MNRYTFTFIVIGFFFLSQDINAQTIPPDGGELTYEYIGSITGIPHHYEATLTIYKTADTTTQVPLTGSVSSSCFPPQVLNLQLHIPINAPMTANGGVPIPAGINCGDTLDSDSLGLYAYYYKDTIVLPGKCADFEFSYSGCCRNPAIANIIDPDTTRFYLTATLNNLSGPNTAIEFLEPPRHLFCKNQSSFLELGGGEPDGDSIAYHLAEVLDSSGKPVKYSSGFTHANPVSSNSMITPGGQFVIDSIHAGVYALVFEAVEYRYAQSQSAWVEVGSSRREMNYTVRDSCPSYLLSSHAGGLILKDTIYGVSCNDSVIGFKTNLFFGDKFFSSGSSFRVIGPDSMLRPVTLASSNINPALLADSIWLYLHKPPSQNGDFLLYNKGKSLYNDCRNLFPPDYAYFVVTDCNTTHTTEDGLSGAISIYPNPTSTKFIVETADLTPYSIVLLDLQGRELKAIQPDSSKSEIDISGFSRGVYLLKVDREVRLIQKL